MMPSSDHLLSATPTDAVTKEAAQYVTGIPLTRRAPSSGWTAARLAKRSTSAHHHLDDVQCLDALTTYHVSTLEPTTTGTVSPPGPGAEAVRSLQRQGLIERNRGSFVLSSDVAFSLGLDD